MAQILDNRRKAEKETIIGNRKEIVCLLGGIIYYIIYTSDWRLAIAQSQRVGGTIASMAKGILKGYINNFEDLVAKIDEMEKDGWVWAENEDNNGVEQLR